MNDASPFIVALAMVITIAVVAGAIALLVRRRIAKSKRQAQLVPMVSAKMSLICSVGAVLVWLEGT